MRRRRDDGRAMALNDCPAERAVDVPRMDVAEGQEKLQANGEECKARTPIP